MTFLRWIRRATAQRIELLRELHHAEAVLGAHVFELDKARRQLAEANLLLSALGREAVGE